MNHWRCGRPENAHAPWCSDGTPDDCTHCGGNPCRWWCLGEDYWVGISPSRGGWGSSAHVRRVLEPA